MSLTAERLRGLLDYDPSTGVFRWKVQQGRQRDDGIAGCPDTQRGYIVIRVDYRMYRAHRLAWLYVHGRWPSMIDHLDGSPANNAIGNLREATISENNQNRPASRKSRSGLKGVAYIRKTGRWNASISFRGKRLNIGNFAEAEKAHDAYCRRARELFGPHANTGQSALASQARLREALGLSDRGGAS